MTFQHSECNETNLKINYNIISITMESIDIITKENDELKEKIILLQKENEELKTHLKKYTAPSRNKKYYEALFPVFHTFFINLDALTFFFLWNYI
jgi:uncharacterized small protein (DUF1192 family)